MQVLFGETSPVGNGPRRGAADVPAGCAVPELDLQDGELVLEAADGRVRPPRVHDESRARSTSRRVPTTSRSASSRGSAAALSRAAAAGAIPTGTPIYLTEFGIQSLPDPIFGVPLAQQAEYLGISEHIAYENPRVKLFSQYLLRDDPTLPGPPIDAYSGFQSGLELAERDEEAVVQQLADSPDGDPGRRRPASRSGVSCARRAGRRSVDVEVEGRQGGLQAPAHAEDELVRLLDGEVDIPQGARLARRVGFAGRRDVHGVGDSCVHEGRKGPALRQDPSGRAAAGRLGG